MPLHIKQSTINQTPIFIFSHINPTVWLKLDVCCILFCGWYKKKISKKSYHKHLIFITLSLVSGKLIIPLYYVVINIHFICSYLLFMSGHVTSVKLSCPQISHLKLGVIYLSQFTVLTVNYCYELN